MSFKIWLEQKEIDWQTEVSNTQGFKNIVAILRKHGAINEIVPRLLKRILVFDIDRQTWIIDDFNNPDPKDVHSERCDRAVGEGTMRTRANPWGAEVSRLSGK